jgi:polyisoprenoid-binding protein YceI
MEHRRMNNIMVLFSMLALYAGTGAAQTPSWKLDKSHSQVKFSVAHMVISEVTGVFKDFDVNFASAADDFTDATIEAAIKTASIDTGNENRDRHVRGEEFLNAEKFPEMRFKSTKVEKRSESNYTVTGDLTIRDVTKSVILDMKYKGSIKDMRGNPVVAFKATTTVDRFEFGTTWDKVIEGGGLVAGKNVEVTLLMEFRKQQ